MTVANAKIFAEPVFNYTRDFPFIWEEMVIPINYQADRGRVEEIMIEAARRHGIDSMPWRTKQKQIFKLASLIDAASSRTRERAVGLTARLGAVPRGRSGR